MRGQAGSGRFTAYKDLTSMYEGMSDDLYAPVGTVVDWYQYDSAATEVDPIYDVGATTVGRVWTGPVSIPVLGLRLIQGRTGQNERGRYVADTMHVVINVGQVDSILDQMASAPDTYLSDRFVYQGQVYEVDQIYPHGLLLNQFTVVSLDAIQLKPEQLVNDQTFQKYAS